MIDLLPTTAPEGEQYATAQRLAQTTGHAVYILVDYRVTDRRAYRLDSVHRCGCWFVARVPPDGNTDHALPPLDYR